MSAKTLTGIIANAFFIGVSFTNILVGRTAWCLIPLFLNTSCLIIFVQEAQEEARRGRA